MKPAERGFHRPRAAGSSPRTQEFTYVQLEIFVWQIRLSFANKAPVCLSRQTMSDSGVYLMLLRASEQVDPRCFPRGLWQDAVLPEAEVNPGPSGSRGGLATTKPTSWDCQETSLDAGWQFLRRVQFCSRWGWGGVDDDDFLGPWKLWEHSRPTAELSLRVVCRTVLCWAVRLVEAFPFELKSTQTWQQSTRRNLYLPTLFTVGSVYRHIYQPLSSTQRGFRFPSVHPGRIEISIF